MPTYKLTYFPLTAIAEPIRFLLSYMEVDFEDVRIPKDQWPAVKPNFPFGKLPVLEIDGKQIHQSGAICRYLAKQAKLGGNDDWENLQLDQAFETFTDFRLNIGYYHYNPSEETKKTLWATLEKETIPFYISRFEEQAKKNNGYFANGRLSWVDLYFVACLDYLCRMANNTDLLKTAPTLSKLKEEVLAIPSIKKWIEKRPVENF